MENLTEKLKNISKEDIIFFLIGISFGLFLYVVYRNIRFEKRMENEIGETLDELKKSIESSKKSEIEAQTTSNSQTSNFSNPTFPLKFGKKGEEVKMLQAWLIQNFEDTELEDSKEYKEAYFGSLTKEAVIKNTKRDKGAISKDYFDTRVVPFFNEIKKGEA